MITEIKDYSISFVIKHGFNFYFQKIGAKILEFDLDSEHKKIYLELMLIGEYESLKVEIKEYHLYEELGKVYIELVEVQTSREWINNIINLYIKSNRFELPVDVSKVANIIL
jgi:hypothetical protein